MRNLKRRWDEEVPFPAKLGFAVTLLVGAVAGVAVPLITAESDDGGVRVPSVVGLQVEDATAAIGRAGLTVGRRRRDYSRRAAREEIGQRPESGATVEPGSAVGLSISKGPCPLRGRIRSPTPGVAVGVSFEAAGTLCAQRLGSRHVWIATRVRNVAGAFPKTEVSGERWNARILEETSGRSLSLVLLAVGRADHRRIMAWFARGERTASFPALRLPRAVRLHSIDLVRG